MQRRASSVCLRVLAMVLFASTLGHPVHAQSNDDDTLEYCYGNDCKSTKTRAIQAMEAAHPDYAGLFEEVDQQVTFQNGRVRPLSFTFRVRPRGPSETLPAVYTMDSASNPAPTYCAASGDPLSPNACGSESALIQGFVAWYEQLYGASRVRHAMDMKGGYVNPFAEVSGSGTAQEPLGQYRQNNWRNGAAMPEVTVTVYNANGTIAYGHGGTMRPLKFTTFRCLKGFHAKGGVNPGYDPGTSNPTEPGTECRPYIGDQVIHTRLRQTTCPPVEGADPKEGNPCSPATGDKAQYETDAEFAGQPFGRSYHSLGQVEQRKTLAPGWVHTYSDRIAGNPASGQPLLLMDGRGQLEVFVRQGTSARWTSETAANKVLDIEAGNTFKLTMQDGSVRRFDAAGRLIRIERLDDAVHIELAYESGRLALATDHTGRRLRFEYTNGRLTTLRLPDDRTVVYGYDSLGNLQSVQYPDGRLRSYHYNEPGLSDANDPHALTGISDDGVRYASFAYDAQNRARLTQHHADGQIVDRVQLVYGQNGVVDVIGSRGEARRYTVVTSGGYRRVVSVQHANGTVANRYIGAIPHEHEDRLGNITRYEFSDGYESARIEAHGTPQARRIATIRDPTYRVTSRTVSAPSGTAWAAKQQTSYVYNARGQVVSVTESDPSASPVVARTTTHSYCEQIDVDAGSCPREGLLKSVDGPRPGAVDVTTWLYRMADDPACATSPATCAWRKGDPWKVVNALGQTTETLRLDGNGRPLSVRGIDGVVTDFEYDAAGRPTARKLRGTDDASEADDRVVRMDYWPSGEIKRIIQSDGTWTEFLYDSAHRLTGMRDQIGNSIAYALDAAGERTGEQVRDEAGALRRSLGRAYDALGRLQSQTDAYGRSTVFTHDANGQPDLTTDALQRVTDHDHDPLGRLKRTLQNATGGAGNTVETTFEYDALDQLTRVVDPNGLSTHYTRNGLGELKSLQSPDTGTTQYTYDAAGNRIGQTDARGVQTQYAHDALGRVTAISYPSQPDLNVGYVYDVAQADCLAGETFLTGRLAKMTDGSGSTTYCHDRFGQLTRKVQRTQGKTFVLRWQYAANGRLQSMTTPGGAVLDYVYDAQGRMTEIGVTSEGQPRRKVVSNVLYHPFGGPARWQSWTASGNDRVLARTQNLNGQPGVVQAQATNGTPIDGLSLGYEFDEVGNLKRLRDGNQAEPPVRIYRYDALDRLIEAKDAADVVWQNYGYDKTGNRTAHGRRVGTPTQVCGGGAAGGGCEPGPIQYDWKIWNYGLYPQTHRLWTDTRIAREYDAAGNTTRFLPQSWDEAPGDDPPPEDPPAGETESAAYEGTLQSTEGSGTPSASGDPQVRTFSYNAANRMSATAEDGAVTMSYRYNGQGERVYRQGGGKTVHTVFDPSGRWIGDYDANGLPIQEAIWLGDLPVGLLANVNGMLRPYTIEPDALGTPRTVIDPTRGSFGTVVWRWDLSGEAFGDDKPNEDPDGDNTAFVLDLRFPGQQYDSASGFKYNYFRDYDAPIGRYVQSDPIGLQGGISTYSYALENPFVSVDPTGEAPLLVPVLLRTWLRAIAGCLAVRAAYKEIQKYCRKCKEDCDLENAAANCLCWSAVYALRKKYMVFRCDYILPGSLIRGPNTAIKGHARQLLDVKRARNNCCIKAGREIINDFFD